MNKKSVATTRRNGKKSRKPAPSNPTNGALTAAPEPTNAALNPTPESSAALAQLMKTTQSQQVIDTLVPPAIVAALLGEAVSHGDEEQVRICLRALAGEQAARYACAMVVIDRLAAEVTG